MVHAEIVRSAKAAVASAAVLWVCYFSAAGFLAIARGRDPTGLWIAGSIFGLYGAAYLVLLLLFLVPILQIGAVRRLGAAFSVPAACFLALVSIVALALHFADPGDGDPTTVAGLATTWRARPLEFFLYCLPYGIAAAAFAWVRRRLERS